VLGIGGAYIVTAFLKLPFFYSSYLLVLGFAVAIIVGVLAGIYPARKAALLDSGSVANLL
jgi:putative ABC transport system permease protein